MIGQFIQKNGFGILWGVTVILSMIFAELLTAGMSLVLHQEIRSDFLISGLVVSFIVSTIIAYAIIELMRSLGDLDDQNKILLKARDESLYIADVLKETLFDAIESISEAFGLFDADDRLILCNQKYAQTFTPFTSFEAIKNITFAELVRWSVNVKGEIIEPEFNNDIEAWIIERTKRHRQPGGSLRQIQFRDGTWLQVSERPTKSGGIVGVRTDITALKTAQQIADRANKAKSEFLSSVSHEFRTPLNSIIGFAQYLHFNSAEPLRDNQQKAVSNILSSGEHLLSLINEILDLAKIEARADTQVIMTIPVVETVAECLSMLQLLAAQRGITLSLINEVGQVFLNADLTRFRQILINLVSNAIKYNIDQGVVKIQITALNEGWIRIAVTDNGPGIPESHREEVFQPFKRLGLEQSSVHGTGIGLTVTKELVEMMGGQIDFVSQMGVGTTFYVDLLTKPDGAQAIPMTSREESSATQTEVLTAQKTVLYVEDNAANRDLMEQMFQLIANTELKLAPNATLGLQMAKNLLPQLILMDLNLPDIDGFEALRQLRADEATRHIPVAALTSQAMVGDKARGLEAGFDAYLTKPFDFKILVPAIHNLMKPQALGG